ncbi:MAG: TetR/AcrR family transcriptional regulator [Actinomycetota bacterium]|nr:TetR/AcrR family transcriptional regulator [Actinomycetota bacterium]
MSDVQSQRGRGRPSRDVGRILEREQLIKTAALHFAHFGYVGTSLRSLATELGVSLASIQYHTSTKEDLLFAVIDEYVVPQIRSNRDSARAIGANFDPASLKEPKTLEIATQIVYKRLNSLTTSAVIAGVLKDNSKGSQLRREYALKALQEQREASMEALNTYHAIGAMRDVSNTMWTLISMVIVPAIGSAIPVLETYGINGVTVDELLAEFADLLTTGLAARPKYDDSAPESK